MEEEILSNTIHQNLLKSIVRDSKEEGFGPLVTKISQKRLKIDQRVKFSFDAILYWLLGLKTQSNLVVSFCGEIHYKGSKFRLISDLQDGDVLVEDGGPEVAKSLNYGLFEAIEDEINSIQFKISGSLIYNFLDSESVFQVTPKDNDSYVILCVEVSQRNSKNTRIGAHPRLNARKLKIRFKEHNQLTLQGFLSFNCLKELKDIGKRLIGGFNEDQGLDVDDEFGVGFLHKKRFSERIVPVKDSLGVIPELDLDFSHIQLRLKTNRPPGSEKDSFCSRSDSEEDLGEAGIGGGGDGDGGSGGDNQTLIEWFFNECGFRMTGLTKKLDFQPNFVFRSESVVASLITSKPPREDPGDTLEASMRASRASEMKESESLTRSPLAHFKTLTFSGKVNKHSEPGIEVSSDQVGVNLRNLTSLALNNSHDKDSNLIVENLLWLNLASLPVFFSKNKLSFKHFSLFEDSRIVEFEDFESSSKTFGMFETFAVKWLNNDRIIAQAGSQGFRNDKKIQILLNREGKETPPFKPFFILFPIILTHFCLLLSISYQFTEGGAERTEDYGVARLGAYKSGYTPSDRVLTIVEDDEIEWNSRQKSGTKKHPEMHQF